MKETKPTEILKEEHKVIKMVLKIIRKFVANSEIIEKLNHNILSN